MLFSRQLTASSVLVIGMVWALVRDEWRHLFANLLPLPWTSWDHHHNQSQTKIEPHREPKIPAMEVLCSPLSVFLEYL